MMFISFKKRSGSLTFDFGMILIALYWFFVSFTFTFMTEPYVPAPSV